MLIADLSDHRWRSEPSGRRCDRRVSRCETDERNPYLLADRVWPLHLTGLAIRQQQAGVGQARNSDWGNTGRQEKLHPALWIDLSRLFSEPGVAAAHHSI